MSNPFEGAGPMTIQFVNLNSNDVLVRPEGYRFLHSADLGPVTKRLARIMWNLLQEWGALKPWEFHETVYQFTPSMQEDILEQMTEQLYGVIRRGEEIDRYAIAIGAQDWEELTGSITQEEFYFNFTTDFDYGYRGRLFKFRNIKGVVLPNHKGMALVPLNMLWKQPQHADQYEHHTAQEWRFGY